MGLNISKGNMYAFVTHTFNMIKGKCSHDCSYCFMKQFKLNDIRFDNKELKTELGKDNFIFVGSSCDMWANDIPEDWILKTLAYCKSFDNKYLFQSKNPTRISTYYSGDWIPTNSVIGTTIETNRQYKQMGNTPSTDNRALSLSTVLDKFKTTVTIEPIMNFDLNELLDIIITCNPEWVSIGADSKNHKLPEPSSSKIHTLINGLKEENIKVVLKDNIKRIYGD